MCLGKVKAGWHVTRVLGDQMLRAGEGTENSLSQQKRKPMTLEADLYLSTLIKNDAWPQLTPSGLNFASSNLTFAAIYGYNKQTTPMKHWNASDVRTARVHFKPIQDLDGCSPSKCLNLKKTFSVFSTFRYLKRVGVTFGYIWRNAATYICCRFNIAWWHHWNAWSISHIWSCRSEKEKKNILFFFGIPHRIWNVNESRIFSRGCMQQNRFAQTRYSLQIGKTKKSKNLACILLWLHFPNLMGLLTKGKSVWGCFFLTFPGTRVGGGSSSWEMISAWNAYAHAATHSQEYTHTCSHINIIK